MIKMCKPLDTMFDNRVKIGVGISCCMIIDVENGTLHKGVQESRVSGIHHYKDTTAASCFIVLWFKALTMHVTCTLLLSFTRYKNETDVLRALLNIWSLLFTKI